MNILSKIDTITFGLLFSICTTNIQAQENTTPRQSFETYKFNVFYISEQESYINNQSLSLVEKDDCDTLFYYTTDQNNQPAQFQFLGDTIIHSQFGKNKVPFIGWISLKDKKNPVYNFLFKEKNILVIMPTSTKDVPLQQNMNIYGDSKDEIEKFLTDNFPE